MSTVHVFPSRNSRTPTQALLSALEHAKAGDLQEILVLGYTVFGELYIVASDMDNKDALWLAEELRQYVTGG